MKKFYYEDLDQLMRNNNALKNAYDVAIVGGGVTGIAIYINLIEEWIKNGKKGSISIIEKSSSLGPGLPYDIKQSKNLILNDFITLENIVDNDEYSFVKWLAAKKAEGDPDVIALQIDNLANCYPPRAIFGKYAKWAFKKASNRAIKHGISIDLQYPVEVIDAIKNKNGWELELSNHLNLKAKNLVLATGHMPSDHYIELEGKKGFFATPWEDLSSIPHDEPVCVFGAGLSAIDAAKKLRTQGHTAKIYFVSPSGSMPSIKPIAKNTKVNLKFLNREYIDKPGLTLNDYLELCKLELNQYISLADYDQEHSKEINSKNWLKENIDLVEKGIVRIWQLVLHEIYFSSLPFAWKHFSKEEKEIVLKKYFGPYMKWNAAMPLANAKELMAMLESEQLEIIRGVPEVKEIANGFQLNFKEPSAVKNLNVKYLINGTGMGHNINRNQLLKNMHAHGLIKKAEAGGIDVDPQTYKLHFFKSNKKRQLGVYPNLYAAGPVIFGSNPAVYAIGASAYAGKEIATSINKEPINGYKPGLFHLKNKQQSNDTTNLSTGCITRTKLI